MKQNGSTAHASSSPQTPFLEGFAWEHAPGPHDLVAARVESPFLNAYAEEAAGEGSDPDAEEVRATLAELYDAEFDETLYELAHEAASTVERATHGAYGAAEPSSRLLHAWVEPLRAESELLFENLSHAFARAPVAALSDAEVDRVFGEVANPARSLEPVFEQFFGKLVKKAKSVVKKAASVARKGIALAQKLSPVHLLMGKLKALVSPLIARVLKMAMNKLPASVRPLASKLAKRFLKARGVRAELQLEAEASVDVGTLQREFDERVVTLLFTGDEVGQELMLLEASVEAEQDEGAAIDVRSLESARQAFISEISQVEPHEAGPVVERFVPAILTALQLAERIIGRPRVVATLSKLVAKLIGRFVGPAAAPALSRAIVDTGLKLMKLESAEQETTAGAHALAATVEDVVRRVSEADEETLDDSRLLEAEVQSAFAHAAAAHFPQQMLAEDRRESSTAGGTWLLYPRGGFKKYTRTFDVELTPETARAIQTFGGASLEAFLADRQKLDLPARVRVHLYEAIPGTWLSRIARAEKATAGLVLRGTGAWELFHPLSKQNASALLKEPGLGRDVSGKYTSSQRSLAVGQRVFFLEVPGAAASVSGRTSRVDVALDFPKSELRVSLFLSERQAQRVTAKLNAGAGVGTILSALKDDLARGVRTALSGNTHGRVRIIHEAVDRDGFLGPALKQVGSAVLERLASRVTEWSMKALADHLQSGSAGFVTATQAPADGVTVRITLQTPPGLSAVGAALKGRAAPVPLNAGALFEGAAASSVQVVPGFSG